MHEHIEEKAHGFCVDLARIAEIDVDTGLDECAGVIRDSFAAVAGQFDLDPSTCPSHPAFLETGKLTEMRRKGAQFLGLTMAGRLVGCVAVQIRDKLCRIEKLAVLPEYRHQGFGKRLMEAAKAYARERGCQKASIGIIDENRVLKDWYIGMGFRVTEIQQFEHLPFTVCMMDTII